MLHFLLIVLALLAIWKLLSHGSANGAALVAGLRRLALILAIAGAALGGLFVFVTQTCGSCAVDSTAILLSVVVGFAVVWGAAMVLIWIVKGFLV